MSSKAIQLALITCALVSVTATGQEADTTASGRSAILRSTLTKLDTERDAADKRMTKLKQQIEELSQQTGAVVVATPKEKKEEEKTKSPQKVNFRPPLERRTKKKNVGVICEGGRISMVDFNELLEKVRDKKNTTAFTIQLTDCDFEFHCEGFGGTSPKIVLKRKADQKSQGETPEEAKQPGSRVQSFLAKKSADQFYLDFFLFPDSFDAFRGFRTWAWSQKYEADVGFQVAGEPVTLRLGAGVGTVQ